MKILAGNSNLSLAQEIATYLDLPLAECDVRRFADNEVFVEILENMRGEDVFLIQSTSYPANDHLMELLITIDALKRASAKTICAVIPYYGYARQDRKDQPRVPITAKLVADLLSAAGVDRVVTLDLHAAQIQGFFNIPVDHLYGKPIVIRELRARFGDNCENLTVVSPDVGGVKMARAYSNALGARLAIVAKHRVSATEVEAMQVIGDVEGRDVVLVDDMTETAGTLCAAADILKAQGAKRIFAAVTHAVIGELGHQRIEESAIEEVITTDSTPVTKQGKVTPVSIAGLFGEAIQRIHNGKSVTSLFDIDAPSV